MLPASDVETRLLVCGTGLYADIIERRIDLDDKGLEIRRSCDGSMESRNVGRNVDKMYGRDRTGTRGGNIDELTGLIYLLQSYRIEIFMLLRHVMLSALVSGFRPGLYRR